MTKGLFILAALLAPLTAQAQTAMRLPEKSLGWEMGLFYIPQLETLQDTVKASCHKLKTYEEGRKCMTEGIKHIWALESLPACFGAAKLGWGVAIGPSQEQKIGACIDEYNQAKKYFNF